MDVGAGRGDRGREAIHAYLSISYKIDISIIQKNNESSFKLIEFANVNFFEMLFSNPI